MDIEVKAEEGFPDPESCSEEMLTISLQDYATKKITTWGRKPYVPTQENVIIITSVMRLKCSILSCIIGLKIHLMLLLDGMSDCMIYHIFVEELVGLWEIRSVSYYHLGD